MKTITLTKDNFWNTDLSDIESVFLPKNKKITDLEISMNDSVPSQGSVLLNKVVNNDKLIKPVTFIEKINYILFNKKN
ncbi:MAG: hypothetical protein RBT22_12755 [Aliarcobacter sp.]|jgi:hypothetical protein|nr:hypothetical protein [Aliarcobacter sp.]